MDNSEVLGIRGNTYGVDIQINGECYVKINQELITDDLKEVRLFLMAYRMGRNHKKNEIRTALGL